MAKLSAPFSKLLLDWYRQYGRVLPWRDETTPYRVLVSEFMLQQTRVDTVIPYFHRFLARFPRLEDLATSEEDDVLRLWQGLGYYSRARNLHKTAQKAVECFGGIPQKSEELSSLPGIGPYMEKAIRAFAFALPAVPIDGNLMRVYSRLEKAAVTPDDPKAKKVAEDYFMKRLDSPREFDQALMDLGELVCLPSGEPRCGECPFASICKAHASGNEMDYPLKKQKGKSPVEKRSVLLLLNEQGRIAVSKRPDKGLLASMNEFPNVLGDKEVLLESYPAKNIRYLGHKTHVFSHVKWEMDVYVGEGVMDGLSYLSLSELKEKAALPTAFAKLLSILPRDERSGGSKESPR